MNCDVVVVGDALVDVLRTPSGSAVAPGGSALNVAVGLAILGLQPTLIAMVGDDVDGGTLRRHLAEFGVTLLASRSPRGTGRAVSDRIDGEPSYSFNAASRHRAIEFDDEIMLAIGSAPLVAVSGYPFDDSDQVDALCRAVTATRSPLLVDPNPRLGMMTDRELFAENLLKFSAGSDLLKLGDDDSRLLHSRPVNEAAAAYLDVGARAVLATEGADGVTVHEGRSSFHAEIARDSRPVVDTMGAGDATFAAVLAETSRLGRLPSGAEWRPVLATAMEIAAQTIRVAGGTLRLPTSLSESAVPPPSR